MLRKGPLRHEVNVADVNVLVHTTHNVVSDAVHTEGAHQVGEFVLHKRVAVVRPAGQEDGESSVCLFVSFAVEPCYFVFIIIVSFKGGLQGLGYPTRAHTERSKVVFNLPAQGFVVLESDGGRVNGHTEVHGAAYDVGITRHDRTIITVLALALAFIHHIRQEDAVHALLLQVENVAMHQFGGKTDVVAHHRAHAALILAIGGRLAQYHTQAASGEKRVPERIFLVHAESTGNAYDNGIVGHIGLWPVEEQAEFFGIHVFARLIAGTLVGEDALALVARIVVVATAEGIAVDKTVVLASTALQRFRLVACQRHHVTERDAPCAVLAGMERTTIGTHQFRTVAAVDFFSREHFQSPRHAVVVHRAALHYDMFAQLLGIFQFQHLMQAVVDDGV